MKEKKNSVMKRIIACITVMSIVFSSAVTVSAESTEMSETTVVSEETVVDENDETESEDETSEEETSEEESSEEENSEEESSEEENSEEENSEEESSEEESSEEESSEEENSEEESSEEESSEEENSEEESSEEESSEEESSEEESSEEEAPEADVEESETDDGAYSCGYFNYELNNNQATIIAYTGEETVVSIPSTVNEYPVVGLKGTFNGNTAVTSVNLPAGIVTIGDNTFNGCTRLATVNIPANVTTIGSYVFYKTAITSLSIPESITYIGFRAFAENIKLAKVTTFATGLGGGSVVKWGLRGGYNDDAKNDNCAFEGCTALVSVTMPKYTRVVPNRCFLNCTALERVTLNEILTTIGYNSFNGCTTLPSITVPTNVTKIDHGAFYGCTRLASINFPAKLTFIGNNAFYGTELTNVSLPESITHIGFRAFASCLKLKKVTTFATGLGDEYTEFNWGLRGGYNDDSKYDNCAFEGCTALVSVTMPKYTRVVPNRCFLNCTALIRVTLNEYLNTIGYNSFVGCTALPSITLPASVTTIDRGAFNGCKKLASINFPAKLTSIGNNAFYGTALSSVSLPESITYIGYRAFASCLKLTRVSTFATGFGDEYTKFSWGTRGGYGSDSGFNCAFEGCTALVSVTMPKYIKNVSQACFLGCTSLNNVVLSGITEVIDRYTFGDCTALTSITLPKTITNINEYAFNKCAALKTVNYTGSKTGWSKVIVAANGNEFFSKAKVYLIKDVPSILATKAGEYKVKLEWRPVFNAEMYRVYTYENGTYVRRFSCEGTRTSATVSGLVAGKKYGFVVSVKVNGSWSAYNNAADLVYAVPTGAPKPVIVAAKPGDYKVKLEWQAVPNAEMYRVYTYQNGAYTRKFTCLGSRNVATVTSLVSGAKLGFVVSAKVNGVWTDYTNTADLVYATPTGSPAPVITGISAGDGKVKLSWYAPKGAEMYRVYTVYNNVYTRQFTTNSGTTTATVTGLKNGREYGFVVSAKINGTWTDYTIPELIVYTTPNA